MWDSDYFFPLVLFFIGLLNSFIIYLTDNIFINQQFSSTDKEKIVSRSTSQVFTSSQRKKNNVIRSESIIVKPAEIITPFVEMKNKGWDYKDKKFSGYFLDETNKYMGKIS